MKKSIKLKNKIALGLCATLGMMTLPIATADTEINEVSAYTPTSVTVQNGDFSSTSTSTFPQTATSWTKASGSVNSSTIKAGVISTVLDTFKNNNKSYGLALENTSSLENRNNLNVYMINALDKSARYGIKSSTINLDASSYYKVQVDVRTSLPVLVDDESLNLSSMASIYLNVDDETYNFIGIDTYNGWEKYTFYVHTNKFVAPEISLELWLGSKLEIQSSGAVWFDNVTVTKLASENYYAVDNSTNKTIELDDPARYDATDKIVNPSFEDITQINTQILTNNPDDDYVWKLEKNSANNDSKVITGITGVGSAYNKGFTNIAEDPKSNGKANNQYALFINNTEEAGVVYNSNKFKIEKYTNYLVQVYAKTGTFKEGGATISLVPTNENLDATTFTNIVTTKTDNSITNDWTLYSFYVQGSPFDDEEVYLSLGLGSTEDDDLVKGYVFFDDITISKISYNQYETASTSSTVKKAKLHNINSSSKIANAYFNFVENAFEGDYPLSPSDWTITNKDESSTSGIISSRKDDFESKTSLYYGNIPWYCVGLTPLQYADEDNADNNLLMIHNESTSYQSYTSSTYSLSANEYYKLSIDARTLSSKNAFINVKIGGNTVATFNFKSETEWTTYNTYISTGYGAKELSVELGLGSKDDLANGYAFFDNVIVNTVTADVFNEQTEDNSNKIINFENENFKIYTDNGEDLKTPTMWTTNSADGIASLIGIEVGSSENAFVISTTKENASIKSESKLSYTLDSEKYYLVKFKVKTSEFKDLQNSGAKFGFNEDSNTFFDKIIANNANEYTEFKFYISGADYSTITPYIQLDLNNGVSSEFVKVSEISFEEITETEFSEKQTELEKDETITDALILGSIKEEETNNSSNNNYVGGTFEWYFIPTIITTLALILALIGVIINRAKKKAEKKSKQKKYSNTYDREVTLHKAIIDKEAQAKRKQELDALKEKLAILDDELNTIEQNYQEKISKENVNKEHEFKKYAKERKKVTDKKDELNAQKAYIQSDEYMEETTNKIIEDYDAQKHQEEVQSQLDSSETNEENAESINENIESTNENVEVVIENPDENAETNNDSSNDNKE